MKKKVRNKTKEPMTLTERNQLKWGYFFIAPCIIGLFLFNFGPMLFSLYISTTSWDVISKPEFIGLANYIKLFKDPLVRKSLQVTAYYVLLSVPLTTIIPLLLAMLLNTRIKGISVFRTIFYIPSIVPAVASAAIWMFIYNPKFGLLNNILRALGLPKSDFIYSAKGVIPSLAVMAVWTAGNTVIIYLAGLQGISRQLYEAAEIDGANAISRFKNITVPMMTPIIFYNLVMAMITAMQTFTQGYIMTEGGPANNSLFYALLVYRTAFRDSSMGYASAMSWVLFIIVAVMTAIIFKTSNMWVFNENGD